jgi:hypothetical protein
LLVEFQLVSGSSLWASKVEFREFAHLFAAAAAE